MKAFFEEYGLAIVIIIVVAVLIAVSVATSDSGQKSMNDTYEKFNSNAQGLVDEQMEGFQNSTEPSESESESTGP